MTKTLEPEVLDQVFRVARTCSQWKARTVDQSLIYELYDLIKAGPTSANSCPARFVWVQSTTERLRLATMVSEGNKVKVLAAPLTAIICYDLDFSSTLSRLLPADRAPAMQKMYREPKLAEETALRNSSMQGAYLILAARALGLDCGPISGFDHEAVDLGFLAGTRARSNFLCCLGYGEQPPFQRNPRLTFDEACRFV